MNRNIEVVIYFSNLNTNTTKIGQDQRDRQSEGVGGVTHSLAIILGP